MHTNNPTSLARRGKRNPVSSPNLSKSTLREDASRLEGGVEFYAISQIFSISCDIVYADACYTLPGFLTSKS